MFLRYRIAHLTVVRPCGFPREEPVKRSQWARGEARWLRGIFHLAAVPAASRPAGCGALRFGFGANAGGGGETSSVRFKALSQICALMSERQ